LAPLHAPLHAPLLLQLLYVRTGGKVRALG